MVVCVWFLKIMCVGEIRRLLVVVSVVVLVSYIKLNVIFKVDKVFVKFELLGLKKGL